jgi:hypothetical protein
MVVVYILDLVVLTFWVIQIGFLRNINGSGLVLGLSILWSRRFCSLIVIALAILLKFGVLGLLLFFVLDLWVRILYIELFIWGMLHLSFPSR